VPDHLLTEPGHGPPPDEPGPYRHRFWADRPTAEPPAAVAHETPAATAAPVHGVALGGGAILLLPHPVADRDRHDLAAAAGPLLDLLESRGLIDRRVQ
jgi:hypothetical protein